MELEKFDLEKAKAGRKVVTDQGEEVIEWHIFGKYIVYATQLNTWPVCCELSDNNLSLAPEERYVNQVNGEVRPPIYNSLEEAVKGSLNYTTDEFKATYKLVKV